MRVAKRDDVTGARINLPVSSERVGPLVLRASMYVEYEGISPGGIKAVRFHYEDLDLGAARSIYPNRFGRPDIHFTRDCRVNPSQPIYITGLIVRNCRAIYLLGFAD